MLAYLWYDKFAVYGVLNHPKKVSMILRVLYHNPLEMGIVKIGWTMLNAIMMLETAVDQIFIQIQDSVIAQKVLTIFCNVKKPRINPRDSRICISSRVIRLACGQEEWRSQMSILLHKSYQTLTDPYISRPRSLIKTTTLSLGTHGYCRIRRYPQNPDIGIWCSTIKF